MFLAYFCGAKQRYINSIRSGIIPIFSICGFIAGLVILGKDLGTTCLIVVVSMFMLFVAGLKLRYFILPLILIPPALIYLHEFDAERWSRITSFTNPEQYSEGSGYQLWNSLLALGSGSWTGLGFTKSRMKGMYLPEAHTDFILSIVGEELGFIALAFLVLCYASFMVFSLYISIYAKDRQGMLLGFGISALISLQSTINIGVISGALPTKGIPAPFISYGGSNLVVCLCCVGLLLSIASNEENRERLLPSFVKLWKTD